ncbi:MAG: Gfo/Idh/MocA family oxidoreductase [Clostridia bacterium]|nr:Gfo/Idh/MocA family oxidoreductase [Clostridia bacterium]
MKIAFAGFRHGHIFVLYGQAKNHKDYEIVGAFEEDAAARKSAEEKGVDFNYATYSELLADKDVGVVALGGVFGDRGKMAIEALKAGKHVIADKPLCTSLIELSEIKRLSEEKGLAVSCMFTMRFEKKINAVKKLIDSGKLGEIQNVYIGGQHPLQYGRRPSWYFEKGAYGGVINDLAIHGVDILYYFGLKPEKIVAAREWNAYATEEKEFKDSGQFMLSCENGAGVISDVSYSIPDGAEFGLPYYWQFYIWGTKGVISFAINENKTVYYVKGNAVAQPLEEQPFDGDYLTDFLKVVGGESGVVLPVSDVLRSTEATLKTEKRAQDV